jgi:hypothetical protein
MPRTLVDSPAALRDAYVSSSVVELDTKRHYTVLTIAGATLCADYVHPGPHEPQIGALLHGHGGTFYGGPWRVVDYRRNPERDDGRLIVERDDPFEF